MEDKTNCTNGYMSNMQDIFIPPTAVKKIPNQPSILTHPRDKEKRMSMLRQESFIVSTSSFYQWDSFIEGSILFQKVFPEMSTNALPFELLQN